MVFERVRRYFGGDDPEAVPEVVDRLEGVDRDVAVALVELPVQRRASGELVLRDVDATTAMMDAAAEQLPHARRRRKGWRCASCEGELDEAQAAPQQYGLAVEPYTGPAFSMEVTMPGWACGCGRRQVASDDRSAGDERASSFAEAIMAAMADGAVRRS